MGVSEFEDFEKECVDSADSVYRMVWEQVLLLSLYTRQQLMEQDAVFVESTINFENKLKLVELLWTARSEEEIKEYKELYEELRNGILQKIEEYKDINQISGYLTDISNTHENKDFSDLAKGFLTEILNRHISFSSREPFTHHKHPYSYYAMYRSLTESLSVLRKILELGFSKDDVSEYIFRNIGDQFSISRTYLPEDKDSVSYQFKELLRKTEKLEEAFEVMEKYSDSIDFKPVLVNARSALAKKMGTGIHGIFSVFQKNIITKGEFSKTPVSLFEQMVTCQHDSGKIILEIDNKLLEKYKLLGKLDGVMDAIRRKIAPDDIPLSSREGLLHPYTDRNSLKDIANWYKQAKTTLFVKITDCPSLVASILEFDFRCGIGIFHKNYGIIEIPFNKKTWFSKDGYLLVTAIIQLFLYRNNPVPMFYKPSHLKYDEKASYIENLTKYVTQELCPSQDSDDILSDEIMKEWANLSFDESLSEELPEYIATINRFKRLPIYLKPVRKVAHKIDASQKNELGKVHGNKRSYIWHTQQLIATQKENSKKESYPMDSSFPLPLWS
jgi:hypothetical protein